MSGCTASSGCRAKQANASSEPAEPMICECMHVWHVFAFGVSVFVRCVVCGVWCVVVWLCIGVRICVYCANG